MKTTLLLLIVSLYSNFLIAQTTAIPDTSFEKKLIALGYDTGNIDGTVPTANIDTITSLDIAGSDISSLIGIDDFTALRIFNCSGNKLTSLILTHNKALTQLDCDYNQLTSIDVSKNIALTELDCDYNQLDSIDLTHNKALTFFDCDYNPLSNLDVTQNRALRILFCIGTKLTSLDVSQNIVLGFLECYDNKITSLDLTQNTVLERLWCQNNKITRLDLSQNVILKGLYCNNNQLVCLNLKNGNNTILNSLIATNNPNLFCIQVDNVTYSTVNWLAIDSGVSFGTNCTKCAVGIKDNALSLELSVFPNPTKGTIYVNLEEKNTRMNATLKNNLGQVISYQEFESMHNFTMNINGLAGIYFLSLETLSGVSKTIKVIKE